MPREDPPVAAHLRPADERPSWTQVLARGALVTVITAVTLWVLAWLIGGFSIDRPIDALLAGFVIGLVNAVVWPALAVFVAPVSVLTLGLGAIVLDALMVAAVLDLLPGVELDGFWPAVAITVGLAAVTALLSSAMALDDVAWFDHVMTQRAGRLRQKAIQSDVPGVVFVQLDGLSIDVLRRAMRSGDVPTLRSWLHDGSHRLIGWETGWSSQTGVSQCGILHGSVVDMPAFRWVDKETGRIIVSNRRSSAAEIERRHSDGNGLLAHDGSSYANLFSGDAERAVLTMSVAGRTKEGRVGAGYVRYFSNPQQATRTLIGVVAEINRERRAARQQLRRQVEPHVDRGWTYAFLRAFTTVVSRDVCVQGVLNDIAEGRAAIYVDFLGYDEVAHHSGPERADTLAVLRDLDHQIGRIERSFRWAPRPFRLVVLSDHGQTQGTTFRDRGGESLADVVAHLCGASITGDPDADEGRTESTAWLRQARNTDDQLTATAAPTVLASGSLGLISLPGERRRLLRDEIDARYPDLIPGLLAHPDVGFVLVGAAGGSLVLGPTGSRNLASGEVAGDDPLAPYGGRAIEQVAEVDGYTTVADLMVNSRYDPGLDEVAAFEEQVGSHGGLGGPQTRPFILHPADLQPPAEPVFNSPSVYRLLKQWLADLGQPGAAPMTSAATGRQPDQNVATQREEQR